MINRWTVAASCSVMGAVSTAVVAAAVWTMVALVTVAVGLPLDSRASLESHSTMWDDGGGVDVGGAIDRGGRGDLGKTCRQQQPPHQQQ